MQDRAAKDPRSNSSGTPRSSTGGEPTLEWLTLRNVHSGETRQLAVSGLFEAIGHIPRSELLLGQIDVDPEGYVITQPDSTATNASGVFACGDLVDHTYRQAITAAGSGCQAALDAERYLQHSTTDSGGRHPRPVSGADDQIVLVPSATS